MAQTSVAGNNLLFAVGYYARNSAMSGNVRGSAYSAQKDGSLGKSHVEYVRELEGDGCGKCIPDTPLKKGDVENENKASRAKE